MVKKGYTPEQIINKLREAEIFLSQGEAVAVASKRIGVSAHTCYRWLKEYGDNDQNEKWVYHAPESWYLSPHRDRELGYLHSN